MRRISGPELFWQVVVPGRLSGTIRRPTHFSIQITDALLPFIVFAPLFVCQAHIGIEFQCLDLLSEKVDKLGLEFFDRVFHTAFSNATVLAKSRAKGANWDVSR
jgi:hypothetical protein